MNDAIACDFPEQVALVVHGAIGTGLLIHP